MGTHDTVSGFESMPIRRAVLLLVVIPLLAAFPGLGADGLAVDVGPAQIGFAISPERVWAFLQGQKINASFVPPFVSLDGRPVLLTVKGGALLDAAAGGRAVVEASGVALDTPHRHSDRQGGSLGLFGRAIGLTLQFVRRIARRSSRPRT